MLTDGYDLFAHVAGLLTNVSTSDQQILLDKVLQAALRRIDRHPAGGAAKLFPFPADDLESEEPKTIEIDPSVQFGRPCLTGTGIPTEALYDRHTGGEAVDRLADDYGLAGERVRDAIEYEEQLRTRLSAA